MAKEDPKQNDEAAQAAAREQAEREAAEKAAAQTVRVVRMNTNGAAGCNVFGKEYEADKKGTVLVPAEAVEHLQSHGFTVARNAD